MPRADFKLETIEAVQAAGGKLSRGQMLRIKVSYLDASYLRVLRDLQNGIG